MHRLRVQLALDLRTAVPVAAPPSPLWQSRVRAGKLVVSPEHEDFPTFLAEALDRLAAQDWNAAAAADNLGLSTTQFVNLLKLEPRALQTLNAARQEKGQRALQ